MNVLGGRLFAAAAVTAGFLSACSSLEISSASRLPSPSRDVLSNGFRLITLGAGFVDQEVERVGGRTNAATSRDYTYYYMILPSGRASRGIHVLADMAFNSRFDPAELDREREVVFEEVCLGSFQRSGRDWPTPRAPCSPHGSIRASSSRILVRLPPMWIGQRKTCGSRSRA